MRLIHYSHPAFRSFPCAPRSGFESEIDCIFGAALSDLGTTAAPARFPADLYEDKANTYLRAELPGVNRNDITIELTDGTLTIAATRTRPAREGETAQPIALSRAISVGDDVQTEAITAAYENGVLTVTLPKREAVVPKKITITVK